MQPESTNAIAESGTPVTGEPLYYFGPDGHPNRPWEPAEIVGVKHVARPDRDSLEPYFQVQYPDSTTFLIHIEVARYHDHSYLWTRDRLRRRLKGANAEIRHGNRIVKVLKALLGDGDEPE